MVVLVHEHMQAYICYCRPKFNMHKIHTNRNTQTNIYTLPPPGPLLVLLWLIDVPTCYCKSIRLVDMALLYTMCCNSRIEMGHHTVCSLPIMYKNRIYIYMPLIKNTGSQYWLHLIQRIENKITIFLTKTKSTLTDMLCKKTQWRFIFVSARSQELTGIAHTRNNRK